MNMKDKVTHYNGMPIEEWIEKETERLNAELHMQKLQMLGFPPKPPQPPVLGSGNATMQGPAESFTSSEQLMRMIAMRMRWPEGRKITDFIAAHKSKEQVFVFLVHNGEAITLDDEWGLFPSDTFITKLRLILG